MTKRVLVAITLLLLVSHVQAQTPANLAALDAETLQHFQALLKTDTQSPPGNEIRAVEYLKQVLDKEGIAYQVFAKDPQRPNLVARIKGNGKKKPILIMGHTDVVTVDAKKWTFPPFGAVRDGGYVYGRGAVDDKDNLTAALMLILRLKREGTPLDRDVILLAESGEEGAPDVGAQFMADNHFDAINAEFCFAEGGGVVREGGTVRQANVGTTEKEPRPIEIIARGPNMLAGYYNAPEKTAEVIDADGWFHTGDIGSFDAQGQIMFHGRTKDMMKVGGENVAAAEIEAALQTHPAVKLAQVTGIPHPRYVEVPAAFVELNDGKSASEAELIAHCTGKLASFKLPRHVRFVSEWPMSTSKIQKFRLRDTLITELEEA